MKRERGIILLITLLVMGGLLFFSIAYLNLFWAEKDITFAAENEIKADSAATSGIDDGIRQIVLNSNWRPGQPPDTGAYTGSLLNGLATYMISFDSTQNTIPFSTNNSAGFQSVTGYGGRNVPAEMVHLVTAGRFGSSTRVSEALLKRSALFNYALFSGGPLSLAGNVTVDSYNSALGPYTPTGAHYPGALIGTSSGATNAVTLSGNTTILGRITVGPGGSEASINDGGSTSYDTPVDILLTPATFPVLTAPTSPNLGPLSFNSGSNTITPGTYLSLQASGGGTSVVLQAGVYVFTEDITLLSQSSLVVPAGTGPVTIYALGNIDFGGGEIINETLRAPNLIIYGGPDTTTVKISGGSQVYLGLYAPSATGTITLSGNADIYGSIITNLLTIDGPSKKQATGNVGIHYDTSLSSGIAYTGGSMARLITTSRW